MGESLYVASSGAAARLQQLDIVANNLANSDTVGFRADRALFESALNQAWIGNNGETVPGAAALSQVRTTGLRSTLQPGAVSRTGAPLDVAIVGDGFFSVGLPGGDVGYTRAGSFHVDADGVLVSASGLPVLGGGNPVEVGNAAVRIQADGSVSDDQGNAVGRLDVFTFEDASRLVKQGQSVYRSPTEPEPESLEPHLIPGSVEQSNVKPVNELASLVILQRAFDASMKTLETSDELSQRLIQEVLR